LNIEVDTSFQDLLITQALHKYSFILDLKNNGKEKIKNIVLELCFPEKYMEKTEWQYPHLVSSRNQQLPQYLILTFNYSHMPNAGKRQFDNYLLPGKSLRIFGEGGITILNYFMDHERWDDRFKFDIVWRVYINDGAPIEGKKNLDLLQKF